MIVGICIMFTVRDYGVAERRDETDGQIKYT